MLKPRQKKFLEELPKTGYSVRRAGINAGYSEQYANKAGKKLLSSAIKASAQEIVDTIDNKSMSSAKQTLASLIGMNSADVFSNLKKIALQDKDYGSALKVLLPLARSEGVDITPDADTKVVAPVINVIEKGYTEPLLE